MMIVSSCGIFEYFQVVSGPLDICKVFEVSGSLRRRMARKLALTTVAWK
jgi:hypothetical protein